MDINLNEADLATAVKDFVTKQGISLINQDTVNITFNKGTGANGTSATVSFSDEAAPKKVTRKPRAKAADKTATKVEEPEPVVTTTETKAAEPEATTAEEPLSEEAAAKLAEAAEAGTAKTGGDDNSLFGGS